MPNTQRNLLQSLEWQIQQSHPHYRPSGKNFVQSVQSVQSIQGGKIKTLRYTRPILDGLLYTLLLMLIVAFIYLSIGYMHQNSSKG